jgi:hypothetical protein
VPTISHRTARPGRAWGAKLRAPVVSRKTKVMAAALAAPFVVLVVAGLIVYGPAPGFAFITGLIILPIGLAVWLGVRAGRVTDTVLKTRARPRPALPEELLVEDPSFDLASIDLPLFSRPLANLWSRVVGIEQDGVSLKLFDFVHADMRGEGSVTRTATAGSQTPRVTSGMSVVSCALGLVDADMPLVVVRPRQEKQFTLPDQLKQRDTELGEFNRGFQLFSEEAYAATAIVDQRTIEAIQGFDPGTAIEIGGSAVLLYTSKPGSWRRLVQQAVSLGRIFPRVVATLYPASLRHE